MKWYDVSTGWVVPGEREMKIYPQRLKVLDWWRLYNPIYGERLSFFSLSSFCFSRGIQISHLPILMQYCLGKSRGIAWWRIFWRDDKRSRALLIDRWMVQAHSLKPESAILTRLERVLSYFWRQVLQKEINLDQCWEKRDWTYSTKRRRKNNQRTLTRSWLLSTSFLWQTLIHQRISATATSESISLSFLTFEPRIVWEWVEAVCIGKSEKRMNGPAELKI